ncbi:MAG: hypothetical protein WBJ13_07790 [Sedimentibacter sp.]
MKQLGLMIDNNAEIENDQTLYSLYPAEGDVIGSLSIPVLNKKLPIIQGTGEKELKKGVGHFTQSVLQLHVIHLMFLI